MTTPANDRHAPPHARRSIVLWAFLGAFLLVPLLAMQVTDAVVWDLLDFAVFGAMLAALGLGIKATFRSGATRTTKAAAGIAMVAAFVLVWAQLAVGILPG